MTARLPTPPTRARKRSERPVGRGPDRPETQRTPGRTGSGRGFAGGAGQGPGALLFPLVYAALVLPGVPLGFALFGRRHPAGWIAGAILGYALAVLGIWGAAAIGMLTALLDGGDTSDPHVRLPTSLVRRGTTAAP